MDVSALQGNAPGMEAAADAQKTAQARGQDQQVKPAAADTTQQETSKPKIPGLGENIDVAV